MLPVGSPCRIKIRRPSGYVETTVVGTSFPLTHSDSHWLNWLENWCRNLGTMIQQYLSTIRSIYWKAQISNGIRLSLKVMFTGFRTVYVFMFHSTQQFSSQRGSCHLFQFLRLVEDQLNDTSSISFAVWKPVFNIATINYSLHK